VQRAQCPWESCVQSCLTLANLPGGGIIILGLAEETGFSPVVLPDPAALINGHVNRARQSLIPPISLTTTEMDFDGHRVIVAEIDETPPSAKPCRINQGGAAYLRFWDGDWRLEPDEKVVYG
jgi:ATP-dependent DNA helicase RecG